MRSAHPGRRAPGYSERPICDASLPRQSLTVADPAIERGEVVALLFNVSDIAVAAKTVARYLTGEDDGEEEEDDEG
jgi:hypothetical protein